jgi:hypothetical protein
MLVLLELSHILQVAARNIGLTIMLGAAAHINVEGEWNNDLMEQVSGRRPIS